MNFETTRYFVTNGNIIVNEDYWIPISDIMPDSGKRINELPDYAIYGYDKAKEIAKNAGTGFKICRIALSFNEYTEEENA